jgi:hypothetical protein
MKRSEGPSVRRASITAYCAIGELTNPVTTSPQVHHPTKGTYTESLQAGFQHILSVQRFSFDEASVSFGTKNKRFAASDQAAYQLATYFQPSE